MSFRRGLQGDCEHAQLYLQDSSFPTVVKKTEQYTTSINFSCLNIRLTRVLNANSLATASTLHLPLPSIKCF